jgi:hypothetical protein
MLASFFAVLFFYLGALNALLAGNAGTCTQSDSSELAGAVFSVILYLVAGYSLSRARFFKTALMLLVPVVPVLVWQCILAIKLADGIFRQGLSACDSKHWHIEGGYGPDGNETFYAILWLTLAIVGVAVPFFVARRRLHQSR